MVERPLTQVTDQGKDLALWREESTGRQLIRNRITCVALLRATIY